MINVEGPMPTWRAYLKAVREEVRDGIGVFNEDDELRSLLQECFDRGDALTGAVMWSEGSGTLGRETGRFTGPTASCSSATSGRNCLPRAARHAY
jgi:hypothetical protein